MSDSLTAVAVTAETAAVGGPHDLTALTGAPRTFSPHAYVRADGRNVIVSYSASMRIRELALEGGTWRSNDLTAAAGDPPRGFNPAGTSAAMASARWCTTARARTVATCTSCG